MTPALFHKISNRLSLARNDAADCLTAFKSSRSRWRKCSSPLALGKLVSIKLMDLAAFCSERAAM